MSSNPSCLPPSTGCVEPMNDNSGFAVYPSLRGRTAFVSGGASGLGAEFVSQLVGQGMRVAFVDVDRDGGIALERLLHDAGAEVMFLECDVRDVSNLRQTIGRAA